MSPIRAAAVLLSLPIVGCGGGEGGAAPVLQWRVRSSLAASFHRPRGVAVASDGTIFAVDKHGIVYRFDPSGGSNATWRMPEVDEGQPIALAADAEGGVVVGDTHYARVFRFDRDGRALAIWGRAGTGPGEFTLVRGVAVSRDGRVYVGDAGDRIRVQVFDLSGRFIRQWGGTGTGPGEFRRIQGIEVDDASGRVYVADAANHRIEVFDLDGRFISAIGRMGRGPGEFRYPYDIAIVPPDLGGGIAVLEWGNRRVQLLRGDGSPAGIWSGGDLRGPWAIEIAPGGKALIADADTDRVIVVSLREG
ncbi:MAG: 6-bladed beta-propeller [Planctomycetes bacterium]|nr:6-bladed beta-propeller [Planctomycetota bacterium]